MKKRFLEESENQFLYKFFIMNNESKSFNNLHYAFSSSLVSKPSYFNCATAVAQFALEYKFCRNCDKISLSTNHAA